MGTDKAFVEVAGVPMAQLVAAALAAGGCAPIVLVGGDTELLARFGHPVVDDRFPGQGPAGGVLTALDAVAPGVLVVASCDVPLLDAGAVAALVGALADGAAAAAVAVTDRWQPSLTAWRTTARGDLERAWEQGVRALHELVAAVPHVEVAIDPTVLRNVNTRDELSAADDASR
jgi:molybdopterin-guanine dinucleotide biosynthesis protein A